MKKHTLLTLSSLFLCFGCSKDIDGDDTGETGDTNDYFVFESGDCHSEEVLNAAPELSYVELSANGDLWNTEPAVISSQEELDAWHAANQLEIDASGVDFTTQSILLSQVTLGSTCGALPSVVHVVEIEGAPHLSLELTNPDGACETVCDMTAMAVEIVAVDKVDNKTATVCAREIETCNE
jgi:hypothetical protein